MRKAIARLQLPVFASLLGIAILAALPAQACTVDFGERMHEWVENKAAHDSRAIARSDYRARVLNYMVLGFDDLNLRATTASAHLDSLAETVRKAEQGFPDDLAGALRREQHAAARLDEFYSIRASLAEIQERHEAIMREPTAAGFLSAGLQNVGRATLLASFQEAGLMSENSLVSRYGAYVGVTISEDGTLQSSQVRRIPGDQYDQIVGVLSNLGGAEGQMSYAFYVLLRSGVEDEICRKKVEKQRQLLRKALADLPSRLIQPGEQFELYKSIYLERRARFVEQSKGLALVEASLNERWRNLFTYNAARMAASRAVLTTAKVEELRSKYGLQQPITSLFENLGRARIAADVGLLASYVATKQGEALLACNSLDGLLAIEDAEDASIYAAASYDTFRRQAAFAPLQGLLEARLTDAREARAELAEIRGGLSKRRCGAPPSAKLVAKAKARMPRLLKKVDWAAASVAEMHDALSLATGSLGFCVLYSRDGRVYLCGGDGSPYSAQFGGSDDPESGVLRGANDGGYRTDARIVAKIEAAIGNLTYRVSELESRSAGVEAALPVWSTTNQVALERRLTEDRASRAREQGEQSSFLIRFAPQVAGARAQLDRFLQAPSSQAGAVELVRSIGATDLSLPSIPADAVAPDAPAISGVTASRRAYGQEVQPTRRAIIRERMKVDRDLAQAPQLRSLADAALDEAERFAATGAGAEVIANDLVRDAAALRFHHQPGRPPLKLSALTKEGQRVRVTVDDPARLPTDTLLSRISSFQSAQASQRAQSSVLRTTLSSQDAHVEIRRRAVAISDDITSQARSIFYSGFLMDGARVMAFAGALLDVATSLTPGIGWGRDLYEAVSGRDLFSQEPLDALGKTAAIIGAVTGGLGDEPLDALRALRRILHHGDDPREAQRILDVAESLDQMAVSMSSHATEQQVARKISQEDIDDALNEGTRFWDSELDNILCVGVGTAKGRVAVAVDQRNMVVNTVEWESRSNEQLVKVLWTSHTGQEVRRFWKLFE